MALVPTLGLLAERYESSEEEEGWGDGFDIPADVIEDDEVDKEVARFDLAPCELVHVTREVGRGRPDDPRIDTPPRTLIFSAAVYGQISIWRKEAVSDGLEFAAGVAKWIVDNRSPELDALMSGAGVDVPDGEFRFSDVWYARYQKQGVDAAGYGADGSVVRDVWGDLPEGGFPSSAECAALKRKKPDEHAKLEELRKVYRRRCAVVQRARQAFADGSASLAAFQVTHSSSSGGKAAIRRVGMQGAPYVFAEVHDKLYDFFLQMRLQMNARVSIKLLKAKLFVLHEQWAKERGTVFEASALRKPRCPRC